MPNNIVLLLHGWASSGDSDKSAFIKNALADVAEVVSPTFDYHQPVKTLVNLALLCTDLKNANPDSKIIVVGTSLGAWWAEVVGLVELWPLVLVNPCYDITSLEKYIGLGTSYATGEQFVFTKDDYESYLRLQATIKASADQLYLNLPKTIITATGDDVIPSQGVIEHYSGPDTKVIVYGGGDHRFSDFAYLADAIRKAL